MTDGSARVIAEVVHDHCVAARQGPHQELLDIGEGAASIVWHLDEARRVDPIDPQGCEESKCSQFAARHLGEDPAAYSPDLNPIEQAFAKLTALLCKAAGRSVDDNQLPGINPALIFLSLSLPAGHVRTILLACPQTLL